MFQISSLGRRYGLSRSTLLYYDRIGLLSPSARSGAGYRLYSEGDRQRLEAICAYRHAGLGVEDIRRILASEETEASAVLRRRMAELGREIAALHAKQRVLAGLLKAVSEGVPPAVVDKEAWVEMLRAAGMDEAAMRSWHEEFERRAPQAHHDFLLSLGVAEDEAMRIREWSAGTGEKESSGPA